MLDQLKRLPGWWTISLLLLAIVGWVAFQQLGVLLYKSLQVSLGVVLGYFADKALFRYCTPVDEVEHDFYGGCRLVSRALIVLGTLLALSIGL